MGTLAFSTPFFSGAFGKRTIMLKPYCTQGDKIENLINNYYEIPALMHNLISVVATYCVNFSLLQFPLHRYGPVPDNNSR